MKTLFMILLGVLIGIGAAALYNELLKDKNISCYDCTTTTTQGHSLREIIDVVARYQTTRANVVNANILANPAIGSLARKSNFSDATSIWFSLDTLKKYLCLIETKSERNCPSVLGKLGVRLYYGVYPGAPGSSATAGCHTIYMMPTYNNQGVNTDFDPNYVQSGVPTPVQSLDLNTHLLILNTGGLCPPPQGCTTSICTMATSDGFTGTSY